MRLILNSWNRAPSFDVINAKLGQKVLEFGHYAPTMIEKSLLYFYFWFSSFYQHQYMNHQFGPFWSIFGLIRHHGESKLQNFSIVVSKTILYLKFHFTIDFHLSIIIGIRNTSFGPFWSNFGLMTSPRESKLKYFEKVFSETNSSLQSSIKYWFRSLYLTRYMIYNFRSFLSNLVKITSQEK